MCVEFLLWLSWTWREGSTSCLGFFGDFDLVPNLWFEIISPQRCAMWGHSTEFLEAFFKAEEEGDLDGVEEWKEIRASRSAAFARVFSYSIALAGWLSGHFLGGFGFQDCASSPYCWGIFCPLQTWVCSSEWFWRKGKSLSVPGTSFADRLTELCLIDLDWFISCHWNSCFSTSDVTQE